MFSVLPQRQATFLGMYILSVCPYWINKVVLFEQYSATNDKLVINSMYVIVIATITAQTIFDMLNHTFCFSIIFIKKNDGVTTPTIYLFTQKTD